MQTNYQRVDRIFKAALNTDYDNVSFLGRGATSEAWSISTGVDTFIVRFIPDGVNRPVTYQSEFTILHMLHERGCPVPEPILNSAENSEHIEGITEAWAITRAVEGEALQGGAFPLAAAKELGQVLAIMDTLPATKYGRLAEQAGGLNGLQADAINGLLSRWCWAKLWPFDGFPLDVHPVSMLAPHLAAPLAERETKIMHIGRSNDVVLSHADLHGEHIFVKDDKLTGIIDFGAAHIGSRNWDFASIAFYHGWNAVEKVIEGYTSRPQNRRTSYSDACELALVLGMYKLDKAVNGNATQAKIEHIIRFIEGMLAI